MDRDDPPARAREAETAARFVVNSLAARAQSVAEIEAKLAGRGVADDVARGAIDEALRLGYLDDAELASQIARGMRSRGYGRRRASTALRRRGVPALHADAALDAAYAGADEVELARRALGARAIVDDEAGRRKAVGLLVRRGFASGVAWRAVREALAERGPR